MKVLKKIATLVTLVITMLTVVACSNNKKNTTSSVNIPKKISKKNYDYFLECDGWSLAK